MRKMDGGVDVKLGVDRKRVSDTEFHPLKGNL